MPRPQQIPGLKDHEGRIPGPHELLCGGRLGLPAMEPAAAFVVLLAGKAGAGTVAEPGVVRGHDAPIWAVNESWATYFRMRDNRFETTLPEWAAARDSVGAGPYAR
ncbi:hypothetical protein CVCC1112_4426 [Paenarthrobacter nicotinovorans]|nr:hypothetical protein CVCC1112_4426 [Paenarthrobacter nicotinovorans]